MGKKKNKEKKPINKEQFYLQMKKRYPQTPISIEIFTGVQGPITYICKKCGKKYSVAIASSLYKTTSLCRDCYWPTPQSRWRKVAYVMRKSKKLEWLDDARDIGETVHAKCLLCNENFEREVVEFLRDQKCPFCTPKPLTQEEFIAAIEHMFGADAYEILRYQGHERPSLLRHSCGFIYKVRPDRFLGGRTCPKCRIRERKEGSTTSREA